MKKRIALIALQSLVFIAVYFSIAAAVSLRGSHAPWFTTAFDRGIPFIPAFVWIYISVYFLATVGLSFAVRHMDDEEFAAVIAACYLNIFLFSFFHLAFPRMAIKPAVDTASLSGAAMALIQRLTTRYNTFPSAHVSYALLVAWTAALSYSRNRIISCILIADAFGVVVSTLFVKEHTVLDVLGGICVGLVSVVAAKAVRGAMAVTTVD